MNHRLFNAAAIALCTAALVFVAPAAQAQKPIDVRNLNAHSTSKTRTADSGAMRLVDGKIVPAAQAQGKGRLLYGRVTPKTIVGDTVGRTIVAAPRSGASKPKTIKK